MILNTKKGVYCAPTWIHTHGYVMIRSCNNMNILYFAHEIEYT